MILTILFSADKKVVVWDSLGEEDVRFEFTKEDSHFVRWGFALKNPNPVRKPEYTQCLEVAQRSCAQDYDCTGVSVRKDPKGQTDAYVKYKDSTCAEENGYRYPLGLFHQKHLL